MTVGEGESPSAGGVAVSSLGSCEGVAAGGASSDDEPPDVDALVVDALEDDALEGDAFAFDEVGPEVESAVADVGVDFALPADVATGVEVVAGFDVESPAFEVGAGAAVELELDEAAARAGDDTTGAAAEEEPDGAEEPRPLRASTWARSFSRISAPVVGAARRPAPAPSRKTTKRL